MKISNKVLQIMPSPHRELMALAEEARRKGLDVINFTAGQPGLPPMHEALEILTEGLLKKPFEYSRYIPTQGLYELRVEISKDLKKYGGIDIDPQDIAITTGGAEAIALVLSVVTDSGDEILLFDPCYSVYWGITKFLNLKVVTCEQRLENDFQPDPECIKEKVSSKTTAILVASPDNPTSRVISEEVAKTLVDVAVDRRVWLIYDEAYKHIIYEGSHIWLQKFQGAEEVLISINSFSKDLAIPGFRIGYVYGPRNLIKEIVKVKGFTTITTPTISQYLAYIYLNSGLKEKYLTYALNEYRRRRDAMYNALKKYLPRAMLIKPRASMYFFPDLTEYLTEIKMNEKKFCYEVAKSTNVYILPGSVFGARGKNHVRITFVSESPERIEEGICRIAKFFKKFQYLGK